MQKRKALTLDSEQNVNTIKNIKNTQDVSEPKRENDIDSLFDILKSKKLEKTAELEIVNKPSKKAKATSKSSTTEDKNHFTNAERPIQTVNGIIHSENDVIISPDPPVHRYDKESGLPVYKAHLLLVGKGGGTPLCPFDCDCCF
eukprot:gene5901-11913_t